MKHLLDDAAKLAHGLKGVLTSFTVKGRLLRAIRVSRPNWPEGACGRAADALSRDRVKGPHQFTSRLDYLSYLDVQLTRYAAEHPLVEAFPVADEVGLKRWEQRWQASRQRPEDNRNRAGAHHQHEAA